LGTDVTGDFSPSSLVDAAKHARWTVLYKLIDGFLGALRTIFVPYLGYVLDHSVGFLSAHPPVDSDASHTRYHQLSCLVLTVLQKCFLHDVEHWINKEKFDKLLPALVGQLEIGADAADEQAQSQYDERVQQHLVPSLAQLAVCVGTDTLWKPLNYQVLLRTRHESARVRYAALKVIQEMYRRLGEELLVLLPESVPFLAELMEDSDPRVERLCRDVIVQLEKFLGADALQQYF
jgi:U3 small nucleolar RNA-associated protein 10